MKSLFSLLLFLGSAVFAGEFNPRMLVADLPDGAVLQVPMDLEMGTSVYGADVYHHVVFDKGDTRTDIDLTSFSFPFYTWMLLRTNSEAAVEQRRVSGMFYNYEATFLRAGKYCLNKKLSNLPVINSVGVALDQDRLFFEVCDSGDPAFAIYTNAGLGMTKKQGETRFKVGRFHYHAGKNLRLIR